MTSQNLYNTNGLPDFQEPVSESDARARIAELRMAVLNIEDQIKYREITDNNDPAWFRKASTSRRFKIFELQRIENWLADGGRSNSTMTISDAIVETVRPDYDDADWEGVISAARQYMAEHTT